MTELFERKGSAGQAHGPGVTIIIPHWKGAGLLRQCLTSLQHTRYDSYKILVVDNGCPDGSISEAEDFGNVSIVRSSVNLGFAAGCNLGIRQVTTPYFVLLNNDTETDPDWLGPLVRTAEADESVAAVQPKILNYYQRDLFDYSGAAGGEMDIFGYPFARGRIFTAIEHDQGQYDEPRCIFWASGAASLFRLSAFTGCGMFEEDFFAHMEEIDLCWRLNLAGYLVKSAPESIVYHQSGGTLSSESYRKMYLNHRNSLLMLLRNLDVSSLFWLLPLRILLEMTVVAASLFRGDFTRAAAASAALPRALSMTKTVSRGRKTARRLRASGKADPFRGMYRNSIALSFFLLRKTNISAL